MTGTHWQLTGNTLISVCGPKSPLSTGSPEPHMLFPSYSLDGREYTEKGFQKQVDPFTSYLKSWNWVLKSSRLPPKDETWNRITFIEALCWYVLKKPRDR